MVLFVSQQAAVSALETEAEKQRTIEARRLQEQQPQLCREHPRQELVSYCTTCTSPVCLVCAVEAHKSHAMVSVTVAAAEKRGLLQDMARSALTHSGHLQRSGDALTVRNLSWLLL